jgi:hypothetical protein
MSTLSRDWIVGGLVTIAVVAAIALGIILIGSPAEERVRQLDGRRVQDLAGIARTADLYWTRNGRLPASLEELADEAGASVTVGDPATGARYEYRAIDARTYELCAQFETDSAQLGRPGGADFWSHGAGRQCFRREAQKVD